MSDQPDIYSIWFSAFTGLRHAGRVRLLDMFETPEGIYRAVNQPLPPKSIGERTLTLLQSFSLQDAEELLKLCEEQSIRPVCRFGDPAYPRRLSTIYSPPTVLYVRGPVFPVDETAFISLIGTRTADSYGIRTVKRLTKELGEYGAGAVILTGSRLSDAAAEAAATAGIPCIAVLGDPHNPSGRHPGRQYEGCMQVSEYPPRARSSKSYFRERNRIASGLSLATLLVEAPEDSGTSFFIAEAVDQGRKLFAVPGNVDCKNSAGPLKLLKLGVPPVATADDIMEELRPLYPELISYPEQEREKESIYSLYPEAEPEEQDEEADVENSTLDKAGRGGYIVLQESPVGLTPDQALLVETIRAGFGGMDEIISESGLPAQKVMAQLTVLELKQVIYRDIYSDLK